MPLPVPQAPQRDDHRSWPSSSLSSTSPRSSTGSSPAEARLRREPTRSPDDLADTAVLESAVGECCRRGWPRMSSRIVATASISSAAFSAPVVGIYSITIETEVICSMLPRAMMSLSL
ncbi:MAG: hypothetical protein MZU84_09185 [Sphingobacterium sp.]|nr:hypothetical protein [Sphingobacterium sp.]